MIRNIRHTGIVVPDLQAGTKFYEELGFKPWDKGKVTKDQSFDLYGSFQEIKYQKMYVFDLDRSHSIELYEIQDPDEIGGHHHIAMTVQDINKAFKFFGDKGLLMSRKIVERDNHKLFFAIDPWSNMLELVEPPK